MTQLISRWLIAQTNNPRMNLHPISGHSRAARHLSTDSAQCIAA